MRLFNTLGAVLATLLAACAPLTVQAQTAVVTNPPVTVGQIPTFTDVYGTVAPSGVYAYGGALNLSDPVNGGNMTIAPSNLVLPNSPVILNNSPGPLLMTRYGATSGADDKDFYIYRNANYAGGTFGSTATALTVATNAAAGTKTFEWNLLAQTNNYATAADNSENVSAYLLTHKYGTGKSWAAVSELIDHTTDPIASSVTDEHDMSATGTDANNMRVLFDGWVRNAPGLVAPVEAGYGIRLNTGTNAKWKHGIYLNGSYGEGINLSAGTYTGNKALILGSGQSLCFDGPTCSIVFAGSGSTISTLSNITAFGTVTGGALVSTGNVTGTNLLVSAAGGHLCLDGVACFNNFAASGSTITTASNLTSSGAVQGAGIISTANVSMPSGSNFCISTSCTAWLTYDSGSGQLRLANTVNGTVFTVDGGGATTAKSLVTTGVVTAGGALSGASLSTGSGAITGGAITGTSLNSSGGTITGGAISGSTITGSSTVQGPTVQMSSGNGMTMSGSSMVLNVGGSTRLSLSTGGVIGAQVGGAYAVGFTTGVSCSGAPTASFASVGGIVTHC